MAQVSGWRYKVASSENRSREGYEEKRRPRDFYFAEVAFFARQLRARIDLTGFAS